MKKLLSILLFFLISSFAYSATTAVVIEFQISYGGADFSDTTKTYRYKIFANSIFQDYFEKLDSTNTTGSETNITYEGYLLCDDNANIDFSVTLATDINNDGVDDIESPLSPGYSYMLKCKSIPQIIFIKI